MEAHDAQPTTLESAESLEAVVQWIDEAQKVEKVTPFRTYDEQQRDAVLVTWLCCRRPVYSTHPHQGCLRCLWR